MIQRSIFRIITYTIETFNKEQNQDNTFESSVNNTASSKPVDKLSLAIWAVGFLVLLGLIIGALLVSVQSPDESHITTDWFSGGDSGVQALSASDFVASTSPTMSGNGLEVEHLEPGKASAHVDDFLPVVIFTVLHYQESHPAFSAGNHEINLITPSGQRITPSVANSEAESNYSFQINEQSDAYYFVRDPEPGTWQIEYNPDLDVRIMLEYVEGNVEISAQPQTVSSNEPIDINVYLNNFDECTDKQLDFYAYNEEGERASFNLTSSQNQSIHQGKIQFSESGIYDVTAELVCQHNGETVQRRVYESVNVQSGQGQSGSSPETEQYFDELGVDDPIVRQWYGNYLEVSEMYGLNFQSFEFFDSRKAIQRQMNKERTAHEAVMALQAAQLDMLDEPIISQEFRDGKLARMTEEGMSHEDIKEQARTYLNEHGNLLEKSFQQKRDFYNFAIRNYNQMNFADDAAKAEHMTFSDPALEKQKSDMITDILSTRSELDDMQGPGAPYQAAQEYVLERMMHRVASVMPQE